MHKLPVFILLENWNTVVNFGKINKKHILKNCQRPDNKCRNSYCRMFSIRVCSLKTKQSGGRGVCRLQTFCRQWGRDSLEANVRTFVAKNQDCSKIMVSARTGGWGSAIILRTRSEGISFAILCVHLLWTAPKYLDFTNPQSWAVPR